MSSGIPSQPRSVTNPRQVSRWWKSKPKDTAADLFAIVQILARQNSARRDEDVHHMRLYGNFDIAGRGSELRTTSLFSGAREQRMRFNLCSSIVDTALSLFAGSRPRPMYLTEAGNWEQMQQAELRGKAIAAQLDELGSYTISPHAALDGLVTGTGAIYGFLDPQTRLPKLERVMPMELMVDHVEGIHMKPRNLYRTRLIAREVLQDAFPSKSEKLKDSGGLDQLTHDVYRREFFGTETLSDGVLIVEAWHLPSGPDAKDGRHTVAANNVMLVDEKWKAQGFPFAFYRWKRRQFGFFGMGAVEESRDAQWRINKLIHRIERIGDLGSNAWVFVDRNSKVNIRKITNQPLQIVEYDSPGQPPIIQAFDAIPPELNQQVEIIREQTLAQLGLSTFATEGKKPAGLTSGAAQRAFDDITSRRHILNIQAYEDFFMQQVQLLEMLNDEAVELGENPELSIRSQASAGPAKLITKVRWKEMQNKDNRYVLRMYPTSSLPQTPAGRLATVQEWIGAGLIDGEEALSLLGFADLERTAKLKTADRDKVLRDVTALLHNKGNVTAEPFQSLDKAIELARRSLLVAEIDGAPDAGLTRVQNYIEDLQALRQKAIDDEQAKVLAAQAPPGGPAGPAGAAADLSQGGAPGVAPPELPAGGAIA